MKIKVNASVTSTGGANQDPEHNGALYAYISNDPL